MKEKIILSQGDITEMDVDAIVNAANNDLILGGGVAGAIRRKGGASIQEACNRIGSVPVGEAAITTAGDLKARYVIHAASMSLGGWTAAKSLRNSTKNALLRAEENKLRDIAFPAVGTGVAGFPLEKCAQIMIDIVREHLQGKTRLEKVFFVLYHEKAYQAFKDYYDRI